VVIIPAEPPEEVTVNLGTNRELPKDETELLAWAGDFAKEYHDVFEALAK
jgi:hypothetical protein